MKNYEEITNDLLERRERYVAEQRIKKRKVTKAITFLCCVSLVFLIGIGIWQNEMLINKNILVENDMQHITEDYTVEDNKENSNSEEEKVKKPDKSTIISSYECNFSASYVAPENGKFGLTEPLKNAINEYGDTVWYMVIIDIFKNENQLSPDKAFLETEVKRLDALGYNAFIEENSNGQEIIYHIGIQATAEQILNFNCTEEYGYFLFIRSERID